MIKKKGVFMQLKQIFTPDFDERISRMKNRIISQPHEICIERARIFTDSYKKTRGEPSQIRFAKALADVLDEMSIKIWEDEFIVGNRCSKLVGTPLYPEVRIDTIELDLDLYDTRPVQKFLLSEKDRKELREQIIPYWKNEEDTVQERFVSYLSEDLKQRMLDLVYVIDTDMTNGIGHFFPGHENVFKYGYDGLLETVENKLKDDSIEEEQQLFLNSVAIVLKAVKNFILRFSRLANDMAEKEENPKRKAELKEIAKICSSISCNPPKNFKEAIQLLYFTHLICGIEDGGFAISIGRFDQLLFPYYQKDKKEGKIDDEIVKFLIKCFFIKLSTLWNYVLNKGIIAAEGPPIAENLTVGGLDRNGNDATNDLSYLTLESYAELQTVQPTFSVRVHENTPTEFLIRVGEAVKAGASIALFNDDVMIPGLVNLGYSLEDAREYAPIGCVEPAHPHKTLGCTNASQINVVKCLELALNNGVDMFKRQKIGLDTSKEIKSYEDLWNAFKEQLQFFLKSLVDTMYYLDKAISELSPQPFLSSTIDDCINRGKDITNGGAIYDFTTTQLIGLATVADSLAVIKKIVFENKELSIEELTEMLKRNYRGTYREKKGEEWRQIFLNKIPKFGNDIDDVDLIARDVARLFCEEVRKHKNYRGGNYNPGIYSTSFHLAFGAFTAASADGRKSRDPLSNGVGPSNGVDKKGPTAILNSVKKLDNSLQTNGNSLILAYNPSSFRVDLFPALIRSYFVKDGGYHVQFNVVGKQTLCDAQKHPERYPGLVVRIAGYSVLFNELSKTAQDDIIARTEY